MHPLQHKPIQTELHAHAWWGDAANVEKACTEENINCINDWQRTPLDDANFELNNELRKGQRANYEKIISFLIKKGGLTFKEISERDQKQISQGQLKEKYLISMLGSNTIISVAPNPHDDVMSGQVIDGFGASLTHSSAYLLKNMGSEPRKKILLDLFHRVEGIGLSYLRFPMGTSDFRLEDYTYADLSSEKTWQQQEGMLKDESLNKLDFFSIEKDKECLIPILEEILKINSHIKIMATPWSPPDWMKIRSNNYLRPEMYEVYALYFIKFIKAYAEKEIIINAVTLQNEPDFNPKDYKGMRMSPDDQIRFSIILGKAFKKSNINTKIIAWDHNWQPIEYPKSVLANHEARYYIDGVAFHGYAGEVTDQAKIHDSYPYKNIYFTECGGTKGSSFKADLQWDMKNLVIGATQNWAKCVLKWNLVLDEECVSKISGGHENGRGVITIINRGNSIGYKRNVEYFTLGHASKYIEPGARRITRSKETNIDNLDYAAFENSDKSIVFVLYNNSDDKKSITINLSIWDPQRNHTFEIERKSACTLICRSDSEPQKVITNENRSDLGKVDSEIIWLT